MGIPRGPGGSFHFLPGGDLRFPTGVKTCRTIKKIVARQVRIPKQPAMIGCSLAAAERCEWTDTLILIFGTVVLWVR
jgi:hypothetical protein